MSRYLTAQEVADILGIPKATLMNWRSIGKPSPRAIKVGRVLRYDPEDVRAFVESQKEPAA